MEVLQVEEKAIVKNNSTKPYKEMFNGQVVEFAPGEEQIWDLHEATLFKGQFCPVVKNDVGQTITEKKISVTRLVDPNAPRKVAGYQNPFTGVIYATEAEMKASLLQTRAGVTPIKETNPDSKVGLLEEQVKAQSETIKNLEKNVGMIAEAIGQLVQSKTSKKRPKKEGVTDVTIGDHGRSEVRD